MAETSLSPCLSRTRPPPIPGYACDGLIPSARRSGRDRSSALLLSQAHRPLNEAAIPGGFALRGRLLQPLQDDLSADVQEPALLDRGVGAVGLELLDDELLAPDESPDLGDAEVSIDRGAVDLGG